MTSSRFLFSLSIGLHLLAGIPISAAPPENFGITPDDPSSVQRGIDAAKAAGASRVVIPPGVYHLPRPENVPWHLRFTDLRDMEIMATGVTFIPTGRDRRAILFNYCEGITLRGLTITREVPPFSQGKIASIAGSCDAVDIRIDSGYPVDLDDQRYFPRTPVFNVFKPGTRQLKPLVPDIYITRIERLGADVFRFHTRSPIDARIPLEIGDPAAWRGFVGADIAIWCGARMRLEGITVTNGTGMVFQEINGDGGNVYRDCVITYAPPPAGAVDQPLLSSSADGFNSGRARRGPTFENCRFEGMNDDAINIHGNWAMVMEAGGAGGSTRAVLDVRPGHTGARDYIPFARVGDTLRLYDRRIAFSGEGVVTAFRRLESYVPKDDGWVRSRFFSDTSKAEYWEVTFDRPVTGEGGGMVANADESGSGFVIRNSVFRDIRARGIFIRAGDGLIENNVIERTLMGGIVVAPEVWWNEPDFARNLVIRGNTLRDVGVASPPWNRGLTITAFLHRKHIPFPGGHRDIVVENNTFERVRGANLVITSAIGVTVRGNRFIEPMTDPAFRVENIGIDNDAALVWMREAAEVSFSDNLVVKPGRHFKQLVDADTTVKGTNGLPGGVRVGN